MWYGGVFVWIDCISYTKHAHIITCTHHHMHTSSHAHIITYTTYKTYSSTTNTQVVTVARTFTRRSRHNSRPHTICQPTIVLRTTGGIPAQGMYLGWVGVLGVCVYCLCVYWVCVLCVCVYVYIYTPGVMGLYIPHPLPQNDTRPSSSPTPLFRCMPSFVT